MSQAQHYVTLIARDQSSQVFRQMGSTAQQAATQIKGIGTSAQGTSVQLDRMGSEAQTAATRFDNLEAVATATGAALGTVAAFMARAGAAAEQQRRQIAGLNAAYGAASGQIQQFAREIQASTNFSDEAARQASLTASTLARNYGISTEQVQELVRVSADLAEVYGFDLADAVQRTSSAIRGEAESAEALGLTLSDSFVAAEAAKRGMEGWTTSMTENEKAQFRLQLLIEQTTFAEGEAEKAATGARGAMIDFRDGLQDATVGAGQFLGPAGQMAASLSDLAILLPAAGGVLGKLATIGKLGGAAGAASTALGTGGLAGALAAAAPLMTSLGAAALIAGPAIAAVAVAAHQADEAQRRWNESQAEGTRFLEALPDALGQDQLVRDIVDAFAQWNTVTTITFRDTTIGLEEVNKQLLTLDETSVKALRHFVEAQGGLSPDTIDEVAQEVTRLYTVEQDLERSSLGVVDAQRALMQQEIAQHFREASAAADEINAALDAHESGLRNAAQASRELMAQQDILRSSFSQNFVTPELSSLYRPPDEVARDQAALDAVSDAARRENEDEARAAAERIRDAQVQAAETARDARIRASEEYAQAEEQLAGDIAAIERDRRQQAQDDEREFAKTVHDLQRERIDGERELASELRDIDQERREVATETEEALRDLAAERGEVQREAAEQAQEAEREWLATSRDNLQAQAELRSELQRTTAEAAREWQALNAENLAQQREIQTGLRDTLQEGKLGHRRESQDIRLERDRVIEDRNRALADPDLTEEERQEIILEAQRRLQDLKIAERRAEQDFRREQKQARQEAAAEEQALEDERKRAAEEFHRTQREEAETTSARIADLERERQAAQREFAATQAEAREAAAQQLEALNQRETELLEEQARRFAELEREKQLAQRNSAREQQALAREAAHAQEILGREQAQADRQRLRDLNEAQQRFAETETEIREGLRETARASRDAVREALADVPGGEITTEVAVDLDRDAFDRDLSSVKEEIETLDGPVVEVAVQDDAALAALDTVSRRGEELGRATYTPTIAVTDNASSAIEDATTAATDFGALVEVATLNADDSDLDAKIREANSALDALSERAVSIAILGKTRYAEGEGGKSGAGSGAEYLNTVIDGVNLTLDVLGERDVEVDILANTGAFWGAVRAITSRQNVGSTRILVTADTSTATAAAGRSVGAVADQTFSASLSLDTVPFDLALADAQRYGDAFAAQTFTANLGADVGDFAGGTGFDGALGAAYEAGDIFAETTFTSSFSADISAIEDAVDDAATKLSELTDFEADLEVEANLSSFWRAIRNIDGDTVATAYINTKARGEATSESVGSSSVGRAAISSIPMSALSRGVVVDSAGMTTLPNAPLAAATRAAPRNGSGRVLAGGQIIVYGNVTVQARTPDIAAEIARQIGGQAR